MQNNILIIAGMHRSGTSLTGQWLRACGLNLGDRQLDANHSNKKGHHEDLDFLSFHKDILKSYSRSEKGLDPDINIALAENEYFSARGKSMIGFKNKLRSAWGWKEPRTCLFLDYYHKILPDAKVIVVYREPEEVVDSLIRRDFKRIITRSKKLPFFKRMLVNLRKQQIYNKIKTRESHYLETWNQYNRKILSFLEDKKEEDYLVVSLNEFANYDRQIFNYMKEVWKFPITYTPYKNVFEEKLLSPARETEKLAPLKNLQSEQISTQLARYQSESMQLLTAYHTAGANPRASRAAS